MPRLSSTAVLIAFAYRAVTVIGVVVFLLLWRSTQRGDEIDAEELAHRKKVLAARRPRRSAGTPPRHDLLHPLRRDGPPSAQVVNVEARQFAFVVDAGVVANGRGAGMPAFSGRLSAEQIENVAVYVAAASNESP